MTKEEQLSYLQRVWSQLLASDVDLWSKLDRLFADETDKFGLDYGFFTRIDLKEETQLFEVVHGSHNLLKTGEIAPLEPSYCRKTIAEPKGTMVVNDAPAEGWTGDPAYEKFDFGSYVGTTVRAEEKLYGTLCFANETPRDEPFTDEEITLVEMYAQWATYELDMWSGPPTHDAVRDTVEEHNVSPEQIDAMMSALSNQLRRFVLLTLLEGDNSVDDLAEAIDVEDAKALLYHTHLPKLAQAEYVEWDRDSDSVARGPKFSEVKPLLELLKDHSARFSRS